MTTSSATSTAHSIDAFLAASYGLRLEDVLCEGCLVGRLGPAIAERVKLVPRLVRSTREEDGMRGTSPRNDDGELKPPAVPLALPRIPPLH
ncbi:MAG TPA: hypothetical protein VGU20_29405 [Stellaceae bacterium]|nr:hypothetical protein [Stellaceae bacterium]